MCCGSILLAGMSLVIPEVTLGKRCARLDLEDGAGREQFEVLLSQADILMHGYRPGALDRLGYDQATRRSISPGLIDISLSAYGWSGPWATRRGFDSLVQMSVGIAETGMHWQRSTKPVPLPVQALDHATGYFMAATAIRAVTRRLEEGFGTEARLSLARTAKLLTDAAGRGDWETASFVAKPSLAGLVLRAPVSDAASVSSSLAGFAGLASEPSIADAVRRLLPLRAGQVQSTEVPRVGKASVLTFPSHPPASRGEAEPLTQTPDLSPPGLAWAVDAKEADVGLGQSPKELIAMTRPTTSFRTIPSVEHTVGLLGADASFAALLVPPGCCTGAGPESAPVTLGWGRRAGNGRARLSIGDELLGQIIARAASR